MNKKFKPLYLQLIEELRSEILSGKLKPDEKLPAEVDFAAQRNVSRVTMRLAFHQLEQDGLLIRRKKQGTFIAPDAMSNQALPLNIGIPIALNPDNASYLPALSRYSETAFAIAALAEAGTGLQLLPILNIADHSYLSKFKDSVDGFILNGTYDSTVLFEHIPDKPVVYVETAPPGNGVCAVISDEGAAVKHCYELLKAAGGQRFGFFGGWFGTAGKISGNERRLHFLRNLCRQRNRPLAPDAVEYPKKPDETLREAAIRLLSLPPERRPDSIVVTTAPAAITLLEAAAEAGIHVPEELSIAVVDTSDLYERHDRIRLSGCAKQRKAVGSRAAQLIQEWLRSPKFTPRVEKIPMSISHGETIRNNPITTRK